MPTVPDDLTPSIHDQHTDANIRVDSLPSAEEWTAEMDAALGYASDADRLTEEEIDALYIEHMEAIHEPPAVYHFEYEPMPELRPITTKVRKINLALFGEGGAA